MTSDADVLAATSRVIDRLGPARLTLAAVASEAGLAPATLVQRFGSKRGLLLSFAAQGAAAVAEAFAKARAESPSPLGALFSALSSMTRDVATPEAMANHLAFLQMDLSDPEFYTYTLDHACTVRAGTREFLVAAVEVGELVPCDTTQLARAVQTAFNGALVTWAIFRDGAVDSWVQDDIKTVLRPFEQGLQPQGIPNGTEGRH